MPDPPAPGPDGSEGPDEEALSRAARDARLADALDPVVAAGTELLAGCDVAGVSLLVDGRPVPVAVTDPALHRLAAVAVEEGEGPCLDPAGDRRPAVAPHLADDPRWPTFAPRAARECGMGSLLACPLVTGEHQDRTGTLVLGSRRPAGLGAADELPAVLLASLAALLVDGALRRVHAERALAGRDLVGQATGILMAERRLSGEEAFTQLVQVSQQFHVKVRDLAHMVVDSARRGPGPA